LPIEEIPVGSYIHNVAPTTSKGLKFLEQQELLRLKENPTHAKIELSSGEQRFISPKCYATIGIVSNEYFPRLGKAGKSRWLNKRVTERYAMQSPWWW
jgi:large subunit ribosomal protein L2